MLAAVRAGAAEVFAAADAGAAADDGGCDDALLFPALEEAADFAISNSRSAYSAPTTAARVPGKTSAGWMGYRSAVSVIFCLSFVIY